MIGRKQSAIEYLPLLQGSQSASPRPRAIRSSPNSCCRRVRRLFGLLVHRLGFHRPDPCLVSGPGVFIRCVDGRSLATIHVLPLMRQLCSRSRRSPLALFQVGFGPLHSGQEGKSRNEILRSIGADNALSKVWWCGTLKRNSFMP